ncbi:glycosyltransferase family 4 protein [Thermomonas sp. RSS23]|uniref:Glycosyltransferase family 4 protein n=1 Tax=Thermomonas beijingensis TaxID=2872701 RepID=A0ABS7TCL8_9GAMM|nr:glycosyltransferase family 4 protein [Thermomonas beijingensis]MBZ4185594.1 glycosyltransferase family 4 protein [Thermomonas beijingensis]
MDIAPRWRPVHAVNALVRAVGGGLQLVRDIFLLVLTFARREVDVVHLTTPGSMAVVRDLFVAGLCRLIGKPFVYHIHNGRIPVVATTGSFEWRLTRKVMLSASKVILLDKGSLDSLKLAAPVVDAVVVPNCISHQSLPQPGLGRGNERTILFLGWVVPTKGISELVECWSKLQVEGWRLDIVGPYDEEYRKHLASIYPSDNLFYLGELPHGEAMARMAECDLFVLPSYTEGFPNVVLEAMALARPIVATKVGAVEEMLSGGAGMVIEARSVEALSKALSAAMDDEGLRRQMGHNAQLKAKSLYAIESVFDVYLDIWRKAALTAR